MAEPPPLLPWEKFSSPAIFESLRNIHSFELSVQFPQFATNSDEGLSKRLVDRLYHELYAVATEAGLGAYERIDRFTRGSGSQEGVSYNSDPWEFQIGVRQDQSLIMTRDGSDFRRFYEWYITIMPHFSRFVDAMTDEYEQVIRERAGSDVKVKPARVMFAFRFLLHDFKVPNSPRRVKNSRFLQSLLTVVPSASGGLIPLNEEVLSELGRVDLKISRWNGSYPVGTVREVYEIEAPGNRDYGALWVNFTYIGETSFESEQLPRLTPDIGDVIRRFDIPLYDFLQKRAISNFLSSLSSGISFSSTSGGLP